MRAIVLFVFTLGFSVSWAAIDRMQALDVKKHIYIENGTVVGGEAGRTFSLLDVRRMPASKDKIERIFFDLGDEAGKPLKNRVSYFQVTVEKNNPRVVIDLSQMLGSDIDFAKLKKVFAKSPYVREARINYDPIDTTITVQLILKKPMQVEAFKLVAKDRPSRLVVDLKEKL